MTNELGPFSGTGGTWWSGPSAKTRFAFRAREHPADGKWAVLIPKRCLGRS